MAQVAFTLTRAPREEDRYASDICLVAADGSYVYSVTSGNSRNHSPRWSPNGRELAFISDREGQPRVYVLPLATGGEAIPLAVLPGPAADPAWSPDGSAIAATARVGPDPGDSEPRVVDRLKYKSDGVGQLGGKRRHIFLLPRDGGEPLQVTGGDWDDNAPSWSPDGRMLAFASARHPTRDADQAADIWTVPARGGEPTCLTSSRGPAFNPVWSPDGARIAYVGHEDSAAGSGRQAHLWLVPSAGGPAVDRSASLDRGLAKPPYFAYSPMWAGNQQLIVGVVDAGNVHLHRVSADEDGIVRMGGEYTLLDASASPDGRGVAATRSDWRSPGDVWLYGSGGERRLIDLNPWLDEVYLPAPQRRTFASTDGQPVEGWVLLPEQPQPPLRLVVDVHGGPHNAWGSGFFGGLYWQVLTAAGVGVLYVNPRGSAGCSQGWLEAARGRWGEADLPDLLASAATLIGEGLVDVDRVGICGYSYGGFMVNYTIGHTPAFKAAVSGGGISNLVSFYSTSDIGPFFTDWETGGGPRKQAERYAKLSPISSAYRASAPTLFLHGEADERVPVAQSEEMFVALRRQGKTTELVRYPGASHLFRGPGGRPSHRVDYGRRLAEWMLKYL